MEQVTVSLIISVVALLVSVVVFFQSREKNDDDETSISTRPLQLQAYERLVILCERISLPNLISRVNQPALSAKEMQVILIETIRQEYDYNTSQQVYVSTVAWDAVRNLRDQSLFIINQIAGVMSPDAKANDLNKQLLQVILEQKDKALHSMVLETLNFEAKKLLKK